MICLTCKTECVIFRDADDNLYRRLCPCERDRPCYGCSRQKAVSALLDQNGEVLKYACSKHGNEDTAIWMALSPDPKTYKKENKSEKKGERSDLVDFKKGSPNDVKKGGLPLYAGVCCANNVVATTPEFRCPNCASPVHGELLSNSAIDGFYLNHGERVTSVIILMKIEGHGEYPVQNFVLAIA
jgi:hypothetical protein